MQTLYDELQKNIQFLSYCAAHYYNMRKNKSFTFSEGNKAYLLQKNIKTKQPSKKLDYIKLGPFKMEAVKKPLNYELELPSQMKIHSAFHVMYFESADNNISLEINLPGIDLDNQKIEYEVKAILDQQEIDGQPKYLIKWKSYPHSNNTWKPKNNLNYPTILLDFYRQNPWMENLQAKTDPASQSQNPERTQRKRAILQTPLNNLKK